MSLDLYLRGDPRSVIGASGIYIRVGGESFEITRAEWDRRNPGREPVRSISDNAETTYVWHRNITHNLNGMAMEAGLYEALWRPDEIGATHAHMLIERVEAGLARLVSAPERFARLNPKNGWGNYDLLVDFTQSFLAACKANPNSTVHTDR